MAPIKLNIESWKEILVVTSQNANIDRLAASLALFLGLQKMGKKVQIATEANLTVGQTQLFGIGEIGNRFPQLKGGDMTLNLENVVIDSGPDAGKVPALEKLDWFPEGKDLKLVFHVIPGQRFEPSNVGVSYAHGKFDAILVVGASSLDNLGRIYAANKQTFTSAEIINIDNQAQNSQFGAVNLVDLAAGTVSEMMVGFLNHLGVGMDQDSASNILIGIYNATHNLSQKVTAETFLAVGQAMQVGGKNPQPQKTPLANNGFQTSGSSASWRITTGGSGQFKSNNQSGGNNRQPQVSPLASPIEASSSQQTPQTGQAADPEIIGADRTQPLSGSQPAQSKQNVAPAPAQVQTPAPAPTPVNQTEVKRENPFLAPPTPAVNFNPVFTPQFQFGSDVQVSEKKVEDVSAGGLDLKGFQEQQQATEAPIDVQSQASEVAPNEVNDEEMVDGESEFSPAPDWLTPKVYKSGGLG